MNDKPTGGLDCHQCNGLQHLGKSPLTGEYIPCPCINSPRRSPPPPAMTITVSDACKLAKGDCETCGGKGLFVGVTHEPPVIIGGNPMVKKTTMMCNCVLDQIEGHKRLVPDLPKKVCR